MMLHQEYADTAVAQRAYDSTEPLDLGAGEPARRFVEQNKAGSQRQRTRNFEKALLGMLQ